MVKTKSIDYPNTKLDDALQSVRILIEKLNGEAKNPDSLASLLGHTNAKSSAFILKIGDMRRYGLIERRGDIKATSLAKSMTHPLNDEEKQKALNEIIMGIELWRLLYEKIGRKIPPENEFWTQLVEIANVDRNTAIKEADKIRKLYIDVMTHYKEDLTNRQNQLGERADMDNTFTGDQGRISDNTILFKSGELNISLPKNTANIDVLITILQNMKKEEKKD